MKTSRMLMVLCLGVLGIVGAGCKDPYTINVVNTSNELQKMEVADYCGYTRASLAASPSGGQGYCTIYHDNEDSFFYTLKTNKLKEDFVINKNSPKALFFMVSADKIAGPFDYPPQVTWKTEKAETQPASAEAKTE